MGHEKFRGLPWQRELRMLLSGNFGIEHLNVPYSNKNGNLGILRERSLLHEFGEFHESKRRHSKIFRLTADCTSFKNEWQGLNYGAIVTVARKTPENVSQKDPKLLMWCDQALLRVGGE